jgi:hypothetical protein
MLPSASDRRAWLPLFALFVLLLIAAAFAGAGPWLIQNIAPPINQAFKAVATVFGISSAIHLVLVVPLWALRNLVMKGWK